MSVLDWAVLKNCLFAIAYSDVWVGRSGFFFFFTVGDKLDFFFWCEVQYLSCKTVRASQIKTFWVRNIPT